MSTKSFFASLAVAALVAPSFAAAQQVATNSAELKALGHLAWVTRANDPKPAPRACCNKKARLTTQSAANSAEVKAIGHLAWVARVHDPVPAMACLKNAPTERVAYTSPVELKAFGHLAARAAAPTATAGAKASCCTNALCPMRSVS
jgi:hypothetical protein